MLLVASQTPLPVAPAAVQLVARAAVVVAVEAATRTRGVAAAVIFAEIAKSNFKFALDVARNKWRSVS